MPEESPTRFTMVPARRSSEPTARRRARRILAVLFLAASLSVIAVGVAMVKGNTKADLSTVDPKGRDLAYTAAVNFLAGNPQNVPHASSFSPDDVAQTMSGPSSGGPPVALPYQSLTWTGFSVEQFGSATGGFTDFEVHHFLVVLSTSPASTAPQGGSPPAQVTGSAGTPLSSSADPTLSSSAPVPSPTASQPTSAQNDTPLPASNVVQVDVSVLVTDQGPRLAAAPAFSAWTGGVGGSVGAGDYTNYHNLVTDVSDAAKGQIAEWAKAYVTGDSAGLLTLTADQNTRHRYLGLSGFTLPDSGNAVQVLSAIKAAQGQLVVRVRVLLARTVPGGTVSTSNAQQFVTFADFDVLVAAPNGARPLIVAWGPAGSAAGLQPYSNALTS